MAEASPGPRPRPLSPYMTWRWHVTMTASILHRAAGVGLYAGLLILAGWALALASGADAYQDYCGILTSILGRLVLFGVSVCLFFHLANGLRHLAWDLGKGFKKSTADATAWAALVFGAVAALALWGALALNGAL